MKKKTTEEFIIDAYCVHGDKYNYKLVDYKSSNIKVKIICHIHGVFEQLSNYHLKGSGCPKCSGNVKGNTQQFINRARKVHGDKYNYKLSQYKNNSTKVKIICPIHGGFEQRPSCHINGRGCPKCSIINIHNKQRKSTEQFIIDAYCKHGDKYNYKLSQYKNNSTKVKIICHIHGIFEQRPNSHLYGNGCPKCGLLSRLNKQRKSTEQFIIDAYCKHGDKYNYKLSQYKNSKIKVIIICPEHGIFEQIPNDHVNRKQGCPKCAGKLKKSTEQFIIDAYCIHGDRYNYKLVQYKGSFIKVKIICHEHGIFEQEPNDHVNNKHGCPKCVGRYKEKYSSNGIPVYDTYVNLLEPYGIKCRKNKDDNNILEVKCMYCDRYYMPSINSIRSKISCINGKQSGESNLYCSNECKHACPTYGQKLYPKGYKINTSREVQPALRKMVLKRDNYTCQKCFATNVELHCHHYEGIEVNPIESADMDNCITLCKVCHNDIHKLDKCGIKDYKKEKC